MAQLELRNARVYFQDGYAATAKVNHGGGYSAGVSTMVVDVASTTLVPLASFYVEGDDIMHIVTSTNGTTSITFTPALSEDVLDDADITLGGRTLEVKIGEGNLTYTEARNMEYVLDRGTLDNVREGDDIPVEVQLDFVWEFLTAASGGTPTIEDVIRHRGEAAGWTTSDTADPCHPYALDIVVEHIPPCGGQAPEVVRLPDFRWEGSPHDLRGATVQITGKCNTKEAIVSRPAA